MSVDFIYITLSDWLKALFSSFLAVLVQTAQFYRYRL